MPRKNTVAKRARQDAFISELLINGRSQKDAQAKLGISKGTVTAWKRDPEFMARLNERQQAIAGITEDRIAKLLETALKTVEKSAGDIRDPSTAIKVLEAYAPEVWDPRVRSRVWEQKRAQDPTQQPPQTIFKRGPEPERLRLVKKDDAANTGT